MEGANRSLDPTPPPPPPDKPYFKAKAYPPPPLRLTARVKSPARETSHAVNPIYCRMTSQRNTKYFVDKKE